MNTSTVVHADNGTEFSTIKNELSNQENTWGTLTAVSNKKPNLKKATDHKIPTTWHSGKDKTIHSFKRWVITRAGGREAE